VAQAVLDRARVQSDAALLDAAQADFDAAKAELEAAKQDYDDLLSDQDATDVLEARARLAVANERYETALDRYNSLLTGEDSPRLQAAETALAQAQANVAQAEAKITQAETAVTQAQAQLELLDVQLGKLVVYAPVQAVVLVRSVEPGEVLQPGAAALVLGRLDSLTITIYLPEDRYGETNLGDAAQVTVDSFPGRTFQAEVVRIADRAEFTPRNVQTDEGRRTTVFAVKLTVEDAEGLLKPGMPADVVFGQ
jgi:multidrug resistance efflux pump